MAKKEDKEFKYDILAEIGTVEEGSYQDTIVKVISWNDGDPKLDIRKWNKDENKMGKGISISLDSVQKLKDLLEEVLEGSYETPNDSIDM